MIPVYTIREPRVYDQDDLAIDLYNTKGDICNC